MNDDPNFSDIALLLERVRKGHVQAYAALYDSCRQHLLRAAQRHLADKDLAEDHVHRLFADLWKDRARIPPGADLGFLLEIIKKDCIDTLRHQQVAKKYQLETASRLSPAIDNRSLENKELSRIIKEAFDRVPAHSREVCEMFLRYHYSAKDIAEDRKISVQTVRNQVRDGRVIMQAYLREVYGLTLEHYAIGRQTDGRTAKAVEYSGEDLKAAIASLPQRMGTIVTMKFISRLSTEEICRQLGVAKSTVQTHLLLAARKLGIKEAHRKGRRR